MSLWVDEWFSAEPYFSDAIRLHNASPLADATTSTLRRSAGFGFRRVNPTVLRGSTARVITGFAMFSRALSPFTVFGSSTVTQVIRTLSWRQLRSGPFALTILRIDYRS
jgi:hypothetical protein